MNLNAGISGKLGGKASKKKLIIIAVIILLIATTVIIALNLSKSKQTAANSKTQATAVVTKGDLSVAISGSAPIRSSTKYNFTSNVDGTLTKIYFQDGDKVKAGDLIFEVDDKDTQLKIKQLNNSIAQAQLSHNSNTKDLMSSTVTAPINGEVLEIQAKEGDTLSSNSTLLTITDKSSLKLLVSFSNTYRSKLKVGQSVSINAFDTSTEEIHSAAGVISSISTPSYTTADGSEVYNVGVTINNNSSLTEDMVANVSISIDGITLMSKDSNNLSYIRSMTVKTESGGKLKILNVENGQNVKAGETLAELDNKDLQLTVQTSALKLEDLALQLQTAEEKLLDYKIYAPFDGTITLNDIEQGNSINQGEVLGSVANYDTMEFIIDVDELDISQVAVGQSAKVTIDALTETTANPLKGTVTKIAVEGSSSDGVSTYPVTIQMESNKNLKGSMNANAEIVVSEKTGVLYVPIDALQKRNGKSFVQVVSGNAATDTKGNSVTSNSPASEQKFERREVTTGISTEDYIEIVSGLKEGEVVAVTTTASTTNQMIPGMGGIPGGGMGGPPTGGGGGTNTRRN